MTKKYTKDDKTLIKFLSDLKDQDDEIKAEVEPLPGQKRRRVSNTVMEAIKRTYPKVECAGRSEEQCLIDIFKKRLNERNYQEVVDLTVSLFEAIYKGSTLRTRLSYVKVHVFDQKFLKHPNNVKILDYIQKKMHVSTELHVELEKKSAKSLEQKRENVQEFNADEVLKVIQEQKNSEKWAYRTIALLLASGVRRIELFKVSQFKKDPEREDWIIQVGVAKDKEKRLAIKAKNMQKRKRQEEEEDPEEEEEDNEEDDDEKEEEKNQALDRQVRKPLILLTFEEFTQGVKFVREKSEEKYQRTWKDTENRIVTNLTNQVLRTALKKLFPDQKVTLHNTTRSLYSDISYKLSPYAKNVEFTRWVSLVLGHSEASINTGLNYANKRVKFSLQADDPQLQKKLVDISVQHQEIQQENKDLKQETKAIQEETKAQKKNIKDILDKIDHLGKENKRPPVSAEGLVKVSVIHSITNLRETIELRKFIKTSNKKGQSLKEAETAWNEIIAKGYKPSDSAMGALGFGRPTVRALRAKLKTPVNAA